jgi:hypothetical protein
MPPEDNTQIAIRHVVSGLAMMALDYGMASRRDSDTLVPFVLMESDGQCYTQRFDAEPYETAVAEAKAFLAKVTDSTSAYALAYDGFVTIEGSKFDAILVIAGERGDSTAFVFTQRYDAATDPITPIGSPAFIGPHDSLLGKI